jgi:hypothetical protein
MPDYQLGKIYRITSSNSTQCYIGSTCDPLKDRLSEHKSGYKRFCDGKDRFVTSFTLFQAGGEVEIFLIEDFPCNDKKQLLTRERFFVESEDCINKYRPIITKEEYKKEQRENQREYQQKRKQDPEWAEKERKRKREYKQKKKQDPEWAEKERKRIREKNQRTYKQRKKQAKAKPPASPEPVAVSESA